MRLPLPQLSPQSYQPGHIAEIIETSTTEYLAQCLEPDSLSFAQMPPFGSWVKAVDEDSGNLIYGVVYHATTSPLDSVHRATALGLSLTELREQQPQIFAMLKTEFRVAIVGFCPAGDTQVYQHLPPRPPQVHQAVHRCETAEVIAFTEQLDFLRTLMDMRSAPVDGLIAAVIREIYQLRRLDRDWLVQAGRVLNVLLKDDYDRLRIILAQIHP
ncbi:MAG: HAS-barrel domain-containing protein [Cyanobacteria bacterium P01_D01_bin.71]